MRLMLHMYESMSSGIEVASVIRALKNMAEKGCIPQIFKAQLENVLKTGYVYNS